MQVIYMLQFQKNEKIHQMALRYKNINNKYQNNDKPVPSTTGFL
jgi:hypothetical protein